MPKRRGLEVAHRLVIHAKQPGIIVVTAIGGKRMVADAAPEVADFILQKIKREPPLKKFVGKMRG